MKRFFFASALMLCGLSFAVLAQTTTPTATPETAVEEDVVKISTTLIQVDVTVTDKNGRVITDLKPEEIEIYENGVKQNIKNLSFVSGVKQPDVKQSATNKADKTSIAVPPTATLRPEQIRRTIALVVDDLSLSFNSVYFVRRALKKFVDEQMQDGDLVAIIRTGSGVGALQQFTSDKRQLYAAIERVRWNPSVNGGISDFNLINPSLLETAKASGADVSDKDLEAEANRDQSFSDFRRSAFETGTLGAVDFVIRGMQDLPGRKSLMLLSGGFPLNVKDEQGYTERSPIFDRLERLIDTANRAAVVIYTLDPRGLQPINLTAADNVSALSNEQIRQQLSDRSKEFHDTQEGLIYLAKQTGGFPIINNNQLDGAIRKVLDDQSYYLVGYEPDEATFDAKVRRFNKLEIKVRRAGAQVRYRSGFFGVSDEQVKKNPAANITPGQQIMKALISPFAVSGISLRLNTLFRNDVKNNSYLRFLLHVDAKDLKFTDETDGSKKAVFDVVALVFGDNGTIVDQVAKTYTLSVKGERYQKVLNEGFVYHFPFPIKKAGAYQLRVALRDEQEPSKIGSANQFVEVPNLKKDFLTLSGIVLENMSLEQWRKSATVAAASADNTAAAAVADETNPLADTSLRRFKRGTILRYGSEIYNARFGGAQKPNLTMQIRIYRDGKIIYDGKQIPVEMQGQLDLQRIKFASAFNLGTEMLPGDYVLQIVATDNAAKEKRKIATQFIQFEVVE